MCRLALRFIQLAESPACGTTEHRWLSKELAKLLGETCTRFLLNPSSTQEGRSRSPLLRRSARVGPPPADQEDPERREQPPSDREASSGHREDTRRPRGSSPLPHKDRWKPSLRIPRGGQELLISAAKRGVDRDYLSQARSSHSGSDTRGPHIELKGAPSSKSRASRTLKASRHQPPQEAEEEDRRPVTPPLPPDPDRAKEGKGKSKGKSKGGKKGEEPQKRKKKNKGVKRGYWWEEHLKRRAAKRSQQEEEKEPAEEVEESTSPEEVREAEAALSERVARWSDATEEAGN